MKRYFSKASVITVMIAGGAVLTELAFADWSLPDRIAAKGVTWALIMILVNHVQQNKLTSLRFHRQ